MEHNVPAGADWTILEVDPVTGDVISSQENAYRQRIRQEAERGLVGVDSLYSSVHRDIHRPLIDEQGMVQDNAWLLKRTNQVSLRVERAGGEPVAALDQIAVTIARATISEFAAEVMLWLFALANDPPNWRRRTFTIHLSALLDSLGFKRDARGVHRSDARKRLSTTLLALHLTHVGVQRPARRRGGRSTGFIAPLLSDVGYATRADVRNLSPSEVFQAGLPEEVSVTIHPLWYQGLRGPDGRIGNDYTLVPRPAPPPPGARVGGKRSPVVDLLREYVLRCRDVVTVHEVTLTRQALLSIAVIHDRNPHQAGRTLSRALRHLCTEGTLDGIRPDPLPLSPDALITLSWHAG